MEELNQRTSETALLSVLAGRDAVCIDSITSKQAVVSVATVGEIWPAHTCSAGLAFLADDEAFAERYLAGPLAQNTANTVHSPDLLHQMLEQTRTRGYSVNTSYFRDGVCAVGALVHDARGQGRRSPLSDDAGISVPRVRSGPFRRGRHRRLPAGKHPAGLARVLAAMTARRMKVTLPVQQVISLKPGGSPLDTNGTCLTVDQRPSHGPHWTAPRAPHTNDAAVQRQNRTRWFRRRSPRSCCCSWQLRGLQTISPLCYPCSASKRIYRPGYLAGVYALYAVGLLPGLLAGGTVSDRIGRPAVALPGAALTLTGTICLLFWQDPTGLIIGRLIIGLGAGATFSAGTAWAADLAGATGATTGGSGPHHRTSRGPGRYRCPRAMVSRPADAPFIVSAALSLFAILLTLRRLPQLHLHHHTIRPTTQPAGPTADRSPGGPPTGRSTSAALGWSLPIAPWVFAAATVGLVTCPPECQLQQAGHYWWASPAQLSSAVASWHKQLRATDKWAPPPEHSGQQQPQVGSRSLESAGMPSPSHSQ